MAAINGAESPCKCLHVPLWLLSLICFSPHLSQPASQPLVRCSGTLQVCRRGGPRRGCFCFARADPVLSDNFMRGTQDILRKICEEKSSAVLLMSSRHRFHVVFSGTSSLHGIHFEINDISCLCLRPYCGFYTSFSLHLPSAHHRFYQASCACRLSPLCCSNPA